MVWKNTDRFPVTHRFKCGYCGNKVGTNEGYSDYNYKFEPKRHIAIIWICPVCSKPTYWALDGSLRMPDELPGESVKSLPIEVAAIYEEARECVSTAAYTAAAMLCRKLLMHIAVQKGAEEGKSFIGYVEFLDGKGYIPPDGKHWVDHIRKQGNEANHEIKPMSPETAKELISFVEMLLKFVYEFPAKIPTPEDPKQG